MRQKDRWAERVRRVVRGRAREAKSISLAHLGLTYGAAVVLYCLGGWWLDKKLGTLPLFTLLGVALGAVGGFIWVYREVIRAEQRSRGKRESQENKKQGETRQP